MDNDNMNEREELAIDNGTRVPTGKEAGKA